MNIKIIIFAVVIIGLLGLFLYNEIVGIKQQLEETKHLEKKVKSLKNFKRNLTKILFRVGFF